MKHFGTDIIRGIDLYQSEGARQFCFPSHTVLSLLRGEMRVRAGEKIFSFAGSGIILIPSGRKTDLFCEQSAVFLLIRISPAFLMEAFTRDRLLTEVLSSHELPELLTLVPDLAALVPLFLESAELNRLAVNRLLFTFLERLDHTLGADAPSPDHTVSALQSRQKTVDSYITANIEKQLSLQETAAACGLTPQYLSSFFHKSMNCTFMEYINRIKAEKAREWLLASDLSPEDVCDAAGFKTYSAFCKSIEACYGSSWQQLQKEHVPSFAGLPAEDIIREPAAPLCAVPQILPDEENSAEPLLRNPDMQVGVAVPGGTLSLRALKQHRKDLSHTRFEKSASRFDRDLLGLMGAAALDRLCQLIRKLVCRCPGPSGIREHMQFGKRTTAQET